MNTGMRRSARSLGATYDGNVAVRRAIGYVPVSTDQRPGLQAALRTLERSGDGLVVLKLDRLSRSIRRSGYQFGKVPYGKKTLAAPDNPRMRVLVDDDEELAVIAQLKAWAAQDVGITEMANRLNAAGTPPPQGKQWTKSLIYNLRLRLSHSQPRPVNEHQVQRSVCVQRCEAHAQPGPGAASFDDGEDDFEVSHGALRGVGGGAAGENEVVATLGQA